MQTNPKELKQWGSRRRRRRPEEELAVEIWDLDRVHVYHIDVSKSREREVLEQFAAEPARADHKDLGELLEIVFQLQKQKPKRELRVKMKKQIFWVDGLGFRVLGFGYGVPEGWDRSWIRRDFRVWPGACRGLAIFYLAPPGRPYHCPTFLRSSPSANCRRSRLRQSTAFLLSFARFSLTLVCGFALP